MNETRWDQIWIFLSLDIMENLRHELLLPAVIGKEQRTAIQARLRDFVLEREPLAAGIISLFKTIDPHLSNNAESVFLWGENIFVHGGPDRLAETVWLLAALWLRTNRIAEAEDWVYEVMSRIREARNDRVSKLEDKLAQLRKTALSDWDSEWINRSYGELDPVLEQINLIADCNFFLLGWNKFCDNYPEERLRKLFAVAVEVAKQNNFPHPVPFPDSWRLRTERFLVANERED